MSEQIAVKRSHVGSKHALKSHVAIVLTHSTDVYLKRERWSEGLFSRTDDAPI